MNSSIQSLEDYIDTVYCNIKAMSSTSQTSSAPGALEDNTSKSPKKAQLKDVILQDFKRLIKARSESPSCTDDEEAKEFSKDPMVLYVLNLVVETASSILGDLVQSQYDILENRVDQALENVNKPSTKQSGNDLMDTSFHSTNDEDGELVEESDNEDGDEYYDQESLDAMNAQIEGLQQDYKDIREQMRVNEGRVTRSEKEIGEMHEDILQVQAGLMRNELVFYNVPEHDGEQYNCQGTLYPFLQNEMSVPEHDLQNMYLDKCYRRGEKGGRYPRPIVARFVTSASKTTILSHIKDLDPQKKFGVNDHLPRELEERKKRLIPDYKKARRDRKKPRWARDKLVVDNKVLSVKKDSVKDINVNTTQVASQLQVRETPPKTYQKSSFKGHAVKLHSQDDIVPALHAIYADARVARATHNIYAYRISSGPDVIEHYEDDNEWGAGSLLLKLLQDNDIKDTLVCVTRWYGGTHLGRARFDYIKNAAKEVLHV